MSTRTSKGPYAPIAERIATAAHNGQFRRDGVTPYIEHPRFAVSLAGGDDELETVLWLHDVLEDTAVTIPQLVSEGIPAHVVEAVTKMTKKENVGPDLYLLNIRNNHLACRAKIIDMRANLADDPTDGQICRYAESFLYLLGDQKGGADVPS